MENIILFDTPSNRSKLLPLTYTRPIADLRVGIHKISQKWEKNFNNAVSFLTEDYLTEKFTNKTSTNNLYVAGGVIPNKALLNELSSLDFEMKLENEGGLIAIRTSQAINFDNVEEFSNSLEAKECNVAYNYVEFPWDIFRLNGEEIKADFSFFNKSESQIIEDKNTSVYKSDYVYIEKGANVKASVLNAENGPIFIGKNAEVQEGSLIRGPFALCESAVVNMGAKIKGDTTVGPFSKVGGEISNSVIQGYSNKGHDGFLGNSVIGEWCNLGADTNTSNLKNNYAQVRLWNYNTRNFAKTGLQFCGLIMGDHSKCGINTMFNTGSVVGVNSNIFGSGFPRNFIPSYSWGGANGFTTYTTKKAFEVADVVMQRRGLKLTDEDKGVLNHIFEVSSEFRIWEKEQ